MLLHGCRFGSLCFYICYIIGYIKNNTENYLKKYIPITPTNTKNSFLIYSPFSSPAINLLSPKIKKCHNPLVYTVYGTIFLIPTRLRFLYINIFHHKISIFSRHFFIIFFFLFFLMIFCNHLVTTHFVNALYVNYTKKPISLILIL